MPRKGLGKGLDSLIPKVYDADFDSNSTQSLEDMLKDMEEKAPEEEKSTPEHKNIFEELEEENEGENTSGDDSDEEEKIDTPKGNELKENGETSEGISGDKDSEDSVQNPQKAQVDQTHIDEVKQIVDKNPRITLWSARSSAVFRYLRKTEPEFSISKEASTLIDEAVSKKYPEIWKLFDEY